MDLGKYEKLARVFRAGTLDITLTEPIDVKNIIMKLNILTLFRPMSENSYGLSLKTSDGDCFMLINSSSSRGRQHFTVAHELYHLYIDENPKPHICRDENGKSQTEKDADYFASALLMPEDGIFKMIKPQEVTGDKISIPTIIKLEQYFSVSHIALLIRLERLKVISKVKCKQLVKVPVKESAAQYGYDTTLYEHGNENLILGDYGEKARLLLENGTISEGHYLELIDLLKDGKKG
jgi:Zn-dependent peptidase ImmA (M78 family)